MGFVNVSYSILDWKGEREEGATMKVYVVRQDETPPYCKGCWNEKGECGTPCVDCEKAKKWDVYVLLIFTKKKKVSSNPSPFQSAPSQPQ